MGPPGGPAASVQRRLMGSFNARERQALARALAAGDTLECPACGGEVTRQKVRRPEEVAYVRKRVWLLCSGCRRSGAVDRPNGS